MNRSAILLCFFIVQAPNAVFCYKSTGCALQLGSVFSTNDCSCPGYNLTFECVIDSINDGFIVWKGDALQNVCMLQEIILPHREFVSGITGECNGGTVAWHVLAVENDCYISQLNITYTTSLINRTIECVNDNLTMEVLIGSRIITANKLISYPSPTGIHLESANQSHLTFTWDPVAPECSAIQYIITSTDCGICPNTTTDNGATCNQFQVSTQNIVCAFAVQSVFCGNGIIGNKSNQSHVTLKVPERPLIDAIVPRYSYSTGNTTGFIVQFNEVSSFVISDGIDGSAVSYALAYINSVSGISCGSSTVPASSCVNGVCQHSFTYEFEGSACSSPSVGINITISAANIFGSGSASHLTVVLEKTNTFLNVLFNLPSNSIVCTFHSQQTTYKKSCSIYYWPKGDKTCSFNSASFVQTNYNTSNVVIIGLLLYSLSNVEYCFNVIGDNGTYATVLEGIFIINLGENFTIQEPDNPCQATYNGILLGLSLMFVILFSFCVITMLVVIIIFMVRAYKKLQVELMEVQTLKVPNPTSTTPMRAELKSTNNRIYEDLDGADCSTDQILNVENPAYSKTDFHCSECATPCTGNLGEAEDAYYSTITGCT